MRHRPFHRCVGRRAAGLLTSFCRTRRTLGEFFLEDGLILLEAHAGARLDLGLRRSHGDQSILPPFYLVRQVDANGEICLVDAFCQRQELLHFGLELAFECLDMAIGKCAVA